MSEQPVPETRPACARLGAGRSEVSYLALHPMGFSVPPRLRAKRWAFTPPFHPYRHTANGGLIFCGTIRRNALMASRPRVSQRHRRLAPAGTRLRGIAPCGVRTFLPRLAPGAILRPSKINRNVRRRRRDDKLQAGAIWHGKPHRVQGQRGNPGAARSKSRASGTGFGYWLLRQMILSPVQTGQTKFGVQPFQNHCGPSGGPAFASAVNLNSEPTPGRAS